MQLATNHQIDKQTHSILFSDYRTHAHHIFSASALIVVDGAQINACSLQHCIEPSAGNGDTKPSVQMIEADTTGLHA